MEQTLATTTENRRFGFISLTGPTNAGKSTLINRLVGSKVSIVSHKVQTTRSRIIGIVIKNNSEMAFIDAPGIFIPANRLGKSMVADAWKATQNADKILFLIDGSKTISDTVRRIDKQLRQNKRSFIVAFNKIDKTQKTELLQRASYFSDNEFCDAVFYISARKGDGVEALINYLAHSMPLGAWHYDADEITDMPARLFAAEITREAAFRHLHQELPYHLTVEDETWVETDKKLNIGQIICVEKPAHKAIVLGKGGATIKRIGTESRKQLEKIWQKQVHLRLFVKQRSYLRDNPQRYQIWNPDT